MVTIFIVESKKDVESLNKLGLLAITNGAGNAGKWRESDSAAFRGCNIVIIADKDVPGRKHAIKAANWLYGKVASLKLLELPDRDGHQMKDASDWLAAGGTREELRQLCNKEKEWQPAEQDNMVHLIHMADVQSESVEWLWYPYLPKSKLTLLEGDPGVGKSWVSLAIAAAISLGKGLPGQESRRLAVESSKPASVLLASAEDGLGDTIRPRLNAIGAYIENIHAIEGPLSFDDGGIGIFEKFIRDLHPALIIIDPLVAYIGARVDLHRANETRAILSQLAHISEKYAATILAIRHLAKGGAMRPIYRGLGSIDITAACRSVLLAGCEPENPQKRALVHIKSNLAPMGSSIGYEMRDSNFYWTGESDLTAEQILAADNGTGTSELDEAVTFLKDELAHGEVPAQHIFRTALDTGIGKRTLERAKAKLQAKSKKIDCAWFWYLPESTPPTPPTQTFGGLENIEAKTGVKTERLGGLESKDIPDWSEPLKLDT